LSIAVPGGEVSAHSAIILWHWERRCPSFNLMYDLPIRSPPAPTSRMKIKWWRAAEPCPATGIECITHGASERPSSLARVLFSRRPYCLVFDNKTSFKRDTRRKPLVPLVSCSRTTFTDTKPPHTVAVRPPFCPVLVFPL
jgi:hypothetical protein